MLFLLLYRIKKKSYKYKIRLAKNMFFINYSWTNLRRQCASNVGIRLWKDLLIDITNMSSILKKIYNVLLLAMFLSWDDKVYVVNYYLCD